MGTEEVVLDVEVDSESSLLTECASHPLVELDTV